MRKAFKRRQAWIQEGLVGDARKHSLKGRACAKGQPQFVESALWKYSNTDGGLAMQQAWDWRQEGELQACRDDLYITEIGQACRAQREAWR